MLFMNQRTPIPIGASKFFNYHVTKAIPLVRSNPRSAYSSPPTRLNFPIRAKSLNISHRKHKYIIKEVLKEKKNLSIVSNYEFRIPEAERKAIF